MTKEDKIMASLGRLEVGQAEHTIQQTDLKLQFTNHLEHHRQDSIRDMSCLRKWIWVCIPTIALLLVAVVGAAFYLGRN